MSVLMNEAGDGGGGGGSETALAVTTGTDVALADDGTGGDGTGTDDGALATTAADSNAPIMEGGKLSQSTSRTLRTLEVSNPKLKPFFRQAQRSIESMNKLTEMFGPKPFGPIANLRKLEREIATHAYVNDKGVKVDGLTALREISADVNAHDTLYETADPRLLQLMTETPLGKQALVNLFPHVVQKIRELAPQAYTRWLGSQMLNVLEKVDVSLKNSQGAALSAEPIDMPFRLRRVFGQLPATDEQGKFIGGNMTADQEIAVYNDLSYLYAWIEKIRTWASATPEDLTPPKKDEAAARIAAAEKKAEEAMDTAWRAVKAAEGIALLDTEIRKQTATLNLSAAAIADITARARKSVDKRRNAQPDDMGRRAAYFKAKDMKGYLAYFRRAVEEYGPEAVESAITATGHRANRKAVPAAKDGTAAVGAPGSPQAQPQAGKVIRLTPEQATALGGVESSRWMKPKIGPSAGTTTEQIRNKQMVTRKTPPIPGYPQGLPDGTIVQF